MLKWIKWFLRENRIKEKFSNPQIFVYKNNFHWLFCSAMCQKLPCSKNVIWFVAFKEKTICDCEILKKNSRACEYECDNIIVYWGKILLIKWMNTWLNNGWLTCWIWHIYKCVLEPEGLWGFTPLCTSQRRYFKPPNVQNTPKWEWCSFTFKVATSTFFLNL